MDAAETRELSVFADYNVFFLLAEPTQLPSAKDRWIDEVLAHMIAVRPGAICIGTARRTDVPVTVEIRTTEPESDLANWDHVTEASIDTPTGALQVVGGSDNTSNAPRLTVSPASYRVRVYAPGFNTISADGLDGDDRYHLVLWPGTAQPPRVLKRYAGILPGG